MLVKEVVVTGYDLVAPGVMGAPELFEHIRAGRSCLSAHPTFVDLGFPNTAAGFIGAAQWDTIKTQSATASDLPQNLLAEFVVRQALRQADLQPCNLSVMKAGLFVGANKFCVTTGHLASMRKCMDESGVVDFDRYLDVSASSSDKIFAYRVDAQTHFLSRLFGIRHSIATHSDACAAGTVAIGSAFRAIALGNIDIAICGAVELMANELPYYMFSSLGALCEKGDLPPEQQSRPFMQDRSGFVLSEGAAFLVLESRQHAEARGANVLGRVLGFSRSCEAQKITASQRDGGKYAACMQEALNDAGLSVSDVDHVNTHGTSTQVNDDCEAKAIRQLFSSRLDQLTLTANKSALGHSLASSGAIEAVLSLQSLQKGVALPTLNYRVDGASYPDLDFLSSPLLQPMQVVLSNSFGFGGVNSSLVLGRAA